MADKTPQKRDLGADYEAALRLRTLLTPLMGAPDVLEAAMAAENQRVTTEKAVDGLIKQKGVLEGEIASLTAKADEARTEAHRLIQEANAQAMDAQTRARDAERATTESLAALATKARTEEKRLADAHAKAVHEREQAIAALDGQLARLTAQKDALRKQLE